MAAGAQAVEILMAFSLLGSGVARALSRPQLRTLGLWSGWKAEGSAPQQSQLETLQASGHGPHPSPIPAKQAHLNCALGHLCGDYRLLLSTS